MNVVEIKFLKNLWELTVDCLDPLFLKLLKLNSVNFDFFKMSYKNFPLTF
jgi:hypothetical protein